MPVLRASKSPMEVEEEERVRGRRMTCGSTELSLVKVILWAMYIVELWLVYLIEEINGKKLFWGVKG